MSAGRPDFVLLNMPVVGVERPSIALGTLKAILGRERIVAHTLYANLHWAAAVGLENQRIVEERHMNMLGEWLFAGKAFDGFAGRDPEAYLSGFARRDPARLPFDAEEMAVRLRWLRDRSEAFVDEIADRVLALGPRVVGCTSVFQQHVASLALLRRIRELAPEVVTLIGGSNCETVMGRATHRHFDWVDYVVSGEADDLIGPFGRAVLDHGRNLGVAELPEGVFGPVHRFKGYPTAADTVDGLPRAIVRELRDQPPPAYEDYFADLAASGIGHRVSPTLLVETSRGCWWGRKHLCSFCGLNGAGIDFRSKQPDDVLAELDALAGRHRIDRFEVVDNILDLGYLKTLMPALAKRGSPYRLFFETKSNLRRAQVEVLADAGVSNIQPGIESLHTEVLKIISKGVSATLNLQLLKWCREFGIHVNWNLISEFPDERDEWYREMAEWLPLIHHLQPPGGLLKLQFHRYSAYHQDPERWNLRLSPAPPFRQVYPLDDDELADLVYYFVDLDAPRGTQGRGERPGLAEMGHGVQAWNAAFRAVPPPTLEMRVGREAVDVVDTRAVAPARRVRLSGTAMNVFLACEEARTPGGLIEEMGREGVTAGEVAAVLGDLTARKLVLRLDGHFLSLAVRAPMRPLTREAERPLGRVEWPPPRPLQRDSA